MAHQYGGGGGNGNFNAIRSRFDQSAPPPNPYENGNGNGKGKGNHNGQSGAFGYNGNHGNGSYQNNQYMNHNMGGYNGRNNGNNQQAPPSVGLAIDANPHDHMFYQQAPDSEDSSKGDNNGNNNNGQNDNEQVNIGSYQSRPQMVKISNDDEMGMDILPAIPAIPQMAQINDVNMKPEEEQLHRHVGFVIKLNARLVELNAECRHLYPKLAADLVDSKISEFAREDYKKLVGEKVELSEKLRIYEQQVQTLLSEQDVRNSMQQEIDKLRALVRQYTSSSNNNGYKQKDYREMITSESKQYVTELQKQLDIYRDKVIYLSQQSQSCMATIKNCVKHQQAAQEDIQRANEEIDPLRQHLQWLEESSNDNNHETERLQKEMEKINNRHKAELENFDIERGRLTLEINSLKEKNKSEQSEKMANNEQLKIHMEHKYKSQILALEERLSKMTVARITMEDDFAQRQKQEQERADKYRAKYESVKQHVKTLEMQKVEYTRVNLQLRQQNNQFRGMITQLQNQLKMITIQQQQQQQSSQINGVVGGGGGGINGGIGPMGGGVGGIGGAGVGVGIGGADDPMKQQLMQLQQQQRNLIDQQNKFRAQQERNKQNGGPPGPNGFGGGGFNDPPPIKEHAAHSQSYAVGMNGNNSQHNLNGGGMNGHAHSNTYAHGMNGNGNANNNGAPPNGAGGGGVGAGGGGGGGFENNNYNPQNAMANQMGPNGQGSQIGSNLNIMQSAQRELW
eukprot:CAMPEP_0201570032 /NCGR_PEP_ID=MMETSP0190_2-20130828/12088_1 /ASSEMBLY_ACC=CAM_ASM_000263 /TAXON_ID=37353 /ORGANISM="Rosalina sp." /LENGTH=735 /DNA_ID=CAMNT_0047993123 /DNA_START=110 /DNA_END=2314 /DNA_ORIENTATION=+